MAPPEWMGFLDHDGVLVLNHPDAIRHVLHDNHANYVKGSLYDDLRGLLGEGLLTRDGDSWLSERKLAQPSFHASALESYHRTMVETITSCLREWQSRAEPGRALDVSREMSTLTLRIVAKCLFNVDIAEKQDSILDAITEILPFDPMSRGPFRGRVYKYLPFWAKWRARQALSEFEQGISWVIGHRSGTPDLISSLETSASPRIRDEVASFLLAGYETSAIGLTWALYALSQNPDAERKIRAEIAEVLGQTPPAPRDMSLLTYTALVIRETLRLYPPIPSFGRQAVEDDVIAGFRIPAKTVLRIKPMLIHRHPEFWPEPDSFSPERFSSEQAAGRPQCAYIPFGAGPRTCIGNHFAMMEMKIALPMILQAVRLSPAQGRPVAVISNLTLRPRYGMWMIPRFSSGLA
jgi:cytochrome P450